MYEPTRYPLFPNIAGPFIWYSSTLPFLGMPPKLMPVNAFEQLYREKTGRTFHYIETVLLEPTLFHHFQESSDGPLFANGINKNIAKTQGPQTPISSQELTHWLRSSDNKTALNSLAITWIDNTVGFGVFARTAIKQGTIISLYMGEFILRPFTTESRGYEYIFFTFTGSNETGQVDAEHHGGIARFFSHLPNSQNLAEYVTPETLHQINLSGKKIAVANLLKYIAVYQGCPVLVFRAARDIKAGEQLGYDYSPGYWTGLGVTPMLFDQTGAVIKSMDV